VTKIVTDRRFVLILAPTDDSINSNLSITGMKLQLDQEVTGIYVIGTMLASFSSPARAVVSIQRSISGVINA